MIIIIASGALVIIFKNSQGLTWLFSPEWAELGATAAFSTRTGGNSQEPYHSLNLGLHVGDYPDVVIQNRQNWLKAMHLDTHASPCCAEQVHGSEVMMVNHEHTGRGYLDYRQSLPGIDGMITNNPQLPLLTFYADCLPVYLFDPVKRVIGMIHSGWKGTAARISARAITKMAAEFGCRAADIRAIIGPGIGDCCYEVDERVAGVFRKEFAEIPQLLYSKNQEQRWQLNLRAAVFQTLTAAGMAVTHIEDVNICTCCNPDIFYSYRGEAGQCGRMGALIELE